MSFQNNFVDYSVEQIQDLRKKNTSLEDKMTVLERHLHDAKCEMEMQTLECQKELHLVQHTVSTITHLFRVINFKFIVLIFFGIVRTIAINFPGGKCSRNKNIKAQLSILRWKPMNK